MPETTFTTRSITTKAATEFECLDLMSQLKAAIVHEFKAGINMQYVSVTAARDQSAPVTIEDGNDFYVAQYASDAKIFKYLKSDMSLSATSAAYGDFINCMVIDSTHVFVGGGTAQVIKKYLKSDLSYVTASPAFGANIGGLAVDSTYVYACGWSGRIKKYLKSDLSYDSQATDYTDYGYAMDSDDDFLYVGGSKTSDYQLRKYLKSDLSLVSYARIPQGSDVADILVDGDFVYVLCSFCRSVLRFSKDSLSYIGESIAYGDVVSKLAADNNFIYLAGLDDCVWRLAKPGLEFIEESPDVGDNVISIATDGDYLYASTGTGTKLTKKYSLQDTAEDIIDDLIALQNLTPAITKGDVSDYASEVREIKADGETVLRVLLSLQSMTGGYMEVDNSRQLNWESSIGEDKGQQIRYRKNLRGITRDVDYTTLFNRIYAWSYDHASGKRLRLSDIQTYDYVEDTDSQSDWGGIYVGTFVSYDMLSRESLLEWANQLLAKYKDPFISYKIDVVDLSFSTGFDFDALQLGSTITIIDEELGINVSAIVVKIDHPDLSNPRKMNVEVNNVVRSVVDEMAEMVAAQKKHDHLLAGV